MTMNELLSFRRRFILDLFLNFLIVVSESFFLLMRRLNGRGTTFRESLRFESQLFEFLRRETEDFRKCRDLSSKSNDFCFVRLNLSRASIIVLC